MHGNISGKRVIIEQDSTHEMFTFCAYYVIMLFKEVSLMATKVGTNLSLDPELKKESIELFSDLGMDLSTAVSIFLRQAIRVQGFPFVITRETPNADTIDAINEYYEMKEHPEKYKEYSSFRELMDENKG